MSFTLGNRIKVNVFGQSHAEALGVTIDGLPVGESIDLDAVQSFLERRKGGKVSYTTARKEDDIPEVLSGLLDGKTCGAPLTAVFRNGNVRRKDYDKMMNIPRPSHADYTAWVKYGGKADMSGGGHFSARLTLPMCFAGAVCMQLLEKEGIKIGAHIARIGDVTDDLYSPVSEELEMWAALSSLPVLNSDAGKAMQELMEKTAAEGDSVGGIVECKVTGLPAGLGDPLYESVEARISGAIFGIPAVKGIEFGIGFAAAESYGSRINDPFIIRDGKVKCETNHSGGIQGGITNGMPLVFRTAFKPTPSIYKEQRSVNLDTMEETVLKIEGRHDSCIVPRAVPCVEAMCAIVLYDLLQEK